VTTAQNQPVSSECKPLMDVAHADLYFDNPFRITGLRVDATSREITKQADALKYLEELGHGAGAHIGAFALNPPPSVDKIREAIARLKDPEKRLIDEFFWFWPDRFGESAKDPALQAVDQGDQNTAYQLWIEREPDPETGFVANPSSILDLLLYARSITIF